MLGSDDVRLSLACKDSMAMLERMVTSLDPVPSWRHALRRRLRDRVFASADLAGVFLFGSAARGEDASDLDFLFVFDAPSQLHHYERILVDSVECDVNVVSSAWLDAAWADPEWGYWLTEAFPIASQGRRLIERWQTSANLYWSEKVRSARHASFESMYSALANGARATWLTHPLVGRLLAHEAVRVAVISAIDRHGTRPFSHRTFVTEASKAASAIAFALDPLLVALCPAAASGPGPNAAYLAMRRWVSSALRSPLCVAHGFDRSDPIALRVRSLCDLPDREIERELCRLGGDRILASVAESGAALTQADALLRRLGPVQLRARVSAGAPAVPVLGSSDGIRWRDLRGDRLKLVVGTGGCRTPTCRFCSLPRYGRATARFQMTDLRPLLMEARPGTLALYNDGSLLNPAEVTSVDLVTLCQALREAGVQSLEIESIPRFVFGQQLSRLRELANLASISVAMGLQSVGNTFSVAQLGRPDVDAIFERAIVEAQEAGALVRLYLLWGYGESSHQEWESRLVESVRWAIARGVFRITICPYVDSGQGTSSLPNLLCQLRATLHRVADLLGDRVDVSLMIQPSCGVTYAGSRCAECERVLIARRWREAGACSLQGVAGGAA